MRWFPVDGARCYLSGRDPADAAQLTVRDQPTRKQLYGMVDAGLRVARIGKQEANVDKRGRKRHGRMLFCDRWIDEFLETRVPVSTPAGLRRVG